ncbi:MAG: DUF2092 domain-containing protein [Desulfobacterales bacterium]|jgi:hypothetical protein
MIKRTNLIVLILCGALLSCPTFAQDQVAVTAIDAKADKILRQMNDYLNTLEQFSIHLENSVDILIESGQKIQLGRSVNVSIKRPNRLRADIDGDILSQQLFYDGKNIILYGKKVNYYATAKAPENIESALDYAEQSFGLVAPAADLINRNSYDILTKDIQSGGYVGLSTVSGIECHHLAFRAEETDWQIWIENGKTPLPRKFVITSKWIAGAPQFTAVFRNWDVSPKLKDNRFIFVAPAGAEKINFLPTEN